MTNIMMLHNGRCGSTVVGDLLAQNPNIHWASELYEPIIAKWKEENQQEFAYLAKELIVKNPIELLKNSMHKTTKPYYGAHFCSQTFPFCSSIALRRGYSKILVERISKWKGFRAWWAYYFLIIQSDF